MWTIAEGLARIGGTSMNKTIHAQRPRRRGRKGAHEFPLAAACSCLTRLHVRMGWHQKCTDRPRSLSWAGLRKSTTRVL